MPAAFQMSSGNVFADLGFDAEEAALLRVKSRLLSALSDFVRGFETQRDAAALSVKQPRISEIANGKLSAFSTDLLIRLCERAGIEVTVAAETYPAE
ncbi:MAG: XRE family transcriptional regulator [Bacteroidota bacterium]